MAVNAWLTEINEEHSLNKRIKYLEKAIATMHRIFKELPEESQSLIALRCRKSKCACFCGCHTGTVADEFSKE